MIYLEDLLLHCNFDISVPTKLVRHKDPNVDINDLYTTGDFEDYQETQDREVFRGSSQILSFIATESTHCVFVGKYDVKGIEGPIQITKQRFGVKTGYKYDLKRDVRFDHLRDRLIIDWGNSGIAWVQNFRSQTKKIIELLPEGYVKEFPGYLDLLISYNELKNIINFPVANRLWKRMLSSTSGIYLILDTVNGTQYVGSAHGKDGIYGRWSDYAKNGHGGNEQLKKLIQEDPLAKFRFKFSILQTLSPVLTKLEVATYENLHKEKLGSRVHGLNSN